MIRPTAIGKVVLVLSVAALVALGPAACASDDQDPAGWAIVKVESLDGRSLASICIDERCKRFDAASQVRSGEFSAFVERGTRFEVLRVGDSAGEGASGGSPVGGCVLLELASDSSALIGGCDAVDG